MGESKEIPSADTGSLVWVVGFLSGAIVLFNLVSPQLSSLLNSLIFSHYQYSVTIPQTTSILLFLIATIICMMGLTIHGLHFRGTKLQPLGVILALCSVSTLVTWSVVTFNTLFGSDSFFNNLYSPFSTQFWWVSTLTYGLSMFFIGLVFFLRPIRDHERRNLRRLDLLVGFTFLLAGTYAAFVWLNIGTSSLHFATPQTIPWITVVTMLPTFLAMLRIKLTKPIDPIEHI